MNWEVIFHGDLYPEYKAMPETVQDALLERVALLKEFGPNLGRPWADTLNGSRHANMKELRFNAANGVWRIAFAFDPARRAILLVAGDKAGISERRFYGRLIRQADNRFDDYLEKLAIRRRSN